MSTESENVIDAMELAARMCELREADVTDDDVAAALDERYGVDPDTFEQIVRDLLPFTPTLLSPLSNTCYHVLGWHDDRAFYAIVKAPSSLVD